MNLSINLRAGLDFSMKYDKMFLHYLMEVNYNGIQNFR